MKAYMDKEVMLSAWLAFTLNGDKWSALSLYALVCIRLRLSVVYSHVEHGTKRKYHSPLLGIIVESTKEPVIFPHPSICLAAIFLSVPSLFPLAATIYRQCSVDTVEEQAADYTSHYHVHSLCCSHPVCNLMFKEWVIILHNKSLHIHKVYTVYTVVCTAITM